MMLFYPIKLKGTVDDDDGREVNSSLNSARVIIINIKVGFFNDLFYRINYADGILAG